MMWLWYHIAVSEEFEIIDDLPSEDDDASSDSEAEVLDQEEIEKMLDEASKTGNKTRLMACNGLISEISTFQFRREDQV